jgi:hypothetical protein
MATADTAVSDMLVTVKSREIQRGMLSAMRGDHVGAARHFLAAAHLELVLADDYEQSGRPDLAVRSRLSAASCFWRGGEPEQGRGLLEALAQTMPSRRIEIQQVLADLEQGDSDPRA